MLKITSEEEFNLCLSHNINPLFWNTSIKMDIDLRVYLQNKLFGKSELSRGKIIRANDRYYHYCFEYGPFACENCGTSLHVNKNIDQCYSSTFISHILSRSSHTEMSHDPRNHNKLCFKCHRKWESQYNKEMLIYWDNKVVIIELLTDYQINIMK